MRTATIHQQCNCRIWEATQLWLCPNWSSAAATTATRTTSVSPMIESVHSRRLTCSLVINYHPSPNLVTILDGIGNREDAEPKTKKQKKVDFENDQARKKRLEEELKNIEPPSCGPRWKSCDESCCYTSSLGKSWHKFRAGVYFVAKHTYFEGFILFLIAASTVCLTLEDKNLNDGKNGALKVYSFTLFLFISN